MSRATNHVKHVLFYVGLKPGNLMLVEMEDGTYRILRDDQPVAGHAWGAGELRQAIARYDEMKAQLAPSAGGP